MRVRARGVGDPGSMSGPLIESLVFELTNISLALRGGVEVRGEGRRNVRTKQNIQDPITIIKTGIYNGKGPSERTLRDNQECRSPRLA